MKLPQDPFMLLSLVNTYLRDEYENLDLLCEALEISRQELTEKLSSAGFSYIEYLNQFR